MSSLNRERDSFIGNDMVVLPVEIVRMRAKLRQNHDNLLQAEQDALIEEEEQNIRVRMDHMMPSWTENETSIAMSLLSLYQQVLEKCIQYDIYHSELSGQAKIDHSTMLLSKNKEKYNFQNNLIDSTNISKIESSAQYAYQLLTEYLNIKHEKASEELAIALQTMMKDVEMKGEELWRREITRVMQDWQEGGPLYKAFEESHRASWNCEEEIVSQYVRDQKELAAAMVTKELRKEIRSTVSSSIVRVERHCAHTSDITAAHVSSVERYMEGMHSKGGPDELDMSSTLVSHAARLHDRIEHALGSLKDITRNNLKMAAKVAALKEINNQQPGDDLELLTPSLLEMI
mmetsp:Transcript_26140/g.26369  ORF Transcript_26140/g.26369 Transcript_26140/m.26369 type:complete len:345 (+) Transcript_26140:160-1194(+)